MNLVFDTIGPELTVPEDIRRMLAMAGTKRYRVSVTPLYGQRTKRQNAYFHLLIGRISAVAGCSASCTKDAVKQYALTIGYPPALDENGREILTGDGEFTPKPTHLADSREMGILIDAAMYYAADYGIDPGIPPENEE